MSIEEENKQLRKALKDHHRFMIMLYEELKPKLFCNEEEEKLLTEVIDKLSKDYYNLTMRIEDQRDAKL